MNASRLLAESPSESPSHTRPWHCTLWLTARHLGVTLQFEVEKRDLDEQARLAAEQAVEQATAEALQRAHEEHAAALAEAAARCNTADQVILAEQRAAERYNAMARAAMAVEIRILEQQVRHWFDSYPQRLSLLMRQPHFLCAQVHEREQRHEQTEAELDSFKNVRTGCSWRWPMPAGDGALYTDTHPVHVCKRRNPMGTGTGPLAFRRTTIDLLLSSSLRCPTQRTLMDCSVNSAMSCLEWNCFRNLSGTSCKCSTRRRPTAPMGRG